MILWQREKLYVIAIFFRPNITFQMTFKINVRVFWDVFVLEIHFKTKASQRKPILVVEFVKFLAEVVLFPKMYDVTMTWNKELVFNKFHIPIIMLVF